MFIKVKVTAGSRKEKIEKKSDDHFIVSVKEPAERNLANNRVCEIIAMNFNVNRKAVKIINGHQSSSKILSINI
jgi:uncharacterized protein YggU (UPF0235/DUF167 family)